MTYKRPPKIRDGQIMLNRRALAFDGVTTSLTDSRAR
jgi:hypothetical protein